MADSDFQLALELQKKLNEEFSDNDPQEVSFRSPKPSKVPLRATNVDIHGENEYLNQTQNIVHPQWEILDPTPDVHSLFGAFDSKFFQNKLKCVTLEWSKRMYSCAGICYSRRNRFGMSITIRLSEPLLKLRPRKNLVETMLHEMIHAYCFVLNIREGNGGHGPNFKKIMHAINKVAGTNITVYHTFHDEVELYKQHVWRCNGICQHRAPFFGYVKRTSNRAPGPNDQWWAGHQKSCGGYFQKVQEPEKKKNASSKQKEDRPAGSGDLRKYFGSTKTSTTTNKNSDISTNVKGLADVSLPTKGPSKSNGGGTLVLNPRTKTLSGLISSGEPSIAKAFPPTSYPGLSSDPFNTDVLKKPSRTALVGNLTNVKGFRDLSNTEGGGSPGRVISSFPSSSNATMTGKGYSLDSTVPPLRNSQASSNLDGRVDRELLRNVWAKRFNQTKSDQIGEDAKRRRISNEGNHKSGENDVIFIADENKTAKQTSWDIVDEDLMIREVQNEIIDISSGDESENDIESNHSTSPLPMQKRKNMTADERQTIIKKEILDDTDDLIDEDIILIDDEYDETQENLDISAAVELADTSLIDEFFGEDTLLKEFKDENDVIPSGSRYRPNPDNDIVTCPICQQKLQRKFINEHLDGCTGITVRVKPSIGQLVKYAVPSSRPSRKSSARKSKKQILRDAGYTEADLLNITSSSNEEDEFQFNSNVEHSSPPSSNMDNCPKSVRQKNLYKNTRQCPVCFEEVPDDDINDHLDECLESNRRKSNT